MRYLDFERVAPGEVKQGDILMCYAHDDQWECRNARVVDIEMIDGPGVFRFVADREYAEPYEYRICLHCRHVNMKRLDAVGGPVFQWHLFSWNGVTRYRLRGIETL